MQEVSLRKASGMTGAQKVEKAKAAFLDKTVATIANGELNSLVGAARVGEAMVAVLTREDDGSFGVHFVIKSNAALNAALIAQLSANREMVSRSGDNDSKQKRAVSHITSTAVALEAIKSGRIRSANTSSNRELVDA